MGEDRKTVCSISFAPSVGAAFITTGELLKFDSPFPTAITSLYGAEISIRCNTFSRNRENNSSSYSIPNLFNLFAPPSIPEKLLRRAELVLRYEKGTAQQSVSQDDLPITGNPLLASLIKFNSTRSTTSHHVEFLALWSPGTPLYQTEKIKILDPWLGVGLRLLTVHLSNDRGDGAPPEESQTTTASMALALRASLFECNTPSFATGLIAGGSLLVGGVYGFEGYAAWRFEFPIKKKK